MPEDQGSARDKLLKGARTIAFRLPGESGDESRAARLVVVEGPGRGKVFELESPVNSIGRQQDCAVVLVSITVSRQHATISRQDGLYYLVDKQSSNGVFLNGRKLPPGQSCPLRHGDMLRLGEFVLLFKHEEKLVENLELSAIDLDALKIHQEVDEFLKHVDNEDDQGKTPEKPS